MLIALTGKMGSGKTEAALRLQRMFHNAERQSFADPLKQAICVLLGISPDELESLKRMPNIGLVWNMEDPSGKPDPISMREILQRFGTEVGRDIFGNNFWVDQSLPMGLDHTERFIVNESTRFLNEAQRVRALGGEIWQVIGPESESTATTEGHLSEQPLPDELIDVVIDNSIRDDDFANLDQEILRALHLSEQRIPIEVVR